ncbi:hypothetical protein [Mycobacterium sp.]
MKKGPNRSRPWVSLSSTIGAADSIVTGIAFSHNVTDSGMQMVGR